jgi:hypothetical protein
MWDLSPLQSAVYPLIQHLTSPSPLFSVPLLIKGNNTQDIPFRGVCKRPDAAVDVDKGPADQDACISVPCAPAVMTCRVAPFRFLWRPQLLTRPHPLPSQRNVSPIPVAALHLHY